MIAARVDRATVTYLSQPVLREIKWEVHDDRCVGLVGPNGSGKSTLLRLLAGLQPADSGGVVLARGVTVGLLPQEISFPQGRTVWGEALSASQEIARLEAELARVEEQLGDPLVYGDERLLRRALARVRTPAATTAAFTLLRTPPGRAVAGRILFGDRSFPDRPAPRAVAVRH